jgi:hypothetical protein
MMDNVKNSSHDYNYMPATLYFQVKLQILLIYNPKQGARHMGNKNPQVANYVPMTVATLVREFT